MRRSGLQLSPDQWLYLFTLAVAVVMFVLGWNLLRGRVGRALVAIRDHPIAAAAMGIDTALYKSLAFGVSAMYTGVAGALGAIAVQFVAPDSFAVFLSISLPGRHRDRRARVDPGRDLRRAVHPVRAQRRRPDLEGRALGDLRPVPDRFHVPDADGHQRCDPPRLGAAPTRRNTTAQQQRRLITAAIRRRHHVSQTRSLMRKRCARRSRSQRRRPLAQKKYDPGASDTEIKIGNTMPYSGPASAYGTIGKAEAAYFKMVNERGRHQRPQDQLHQPRRRLQPAEDGGDGAQAGRAGRGAARVPDARHAVEHRDPQVHEREEGAAAVRRHRRDQVERPEELPWTMGWQPNYQTEAHDLRQAHPEEQAEREDRACSTRTTTTARTT